MGYRHTPGPWEVKQSKSKPAFNIVGTALGRKYKIASCPIVKFNSAILDEKEHTEVQANAKLIAAAPDLLEACKKVRDKMLRQGINGGNADQFHIMSRAIKKP